MKEEIRYTSINENGEHVIMLHAKLSWRNYEKLLDTLKEIQKDAEDNWD